MVAVVQAAHVRHRHDLARCSRLDASAHGRILAQREMRAPEMVVVDVRSQYSVTRRPSSSPNGPTRHWRI